VNYSYHCTDRGRVGLSLVLLVDLSIIKNFGTEDKR
jgi:hypothetical protein